MRVSRKRRWKRWLRDSYGHQCMKPGCTTCRGLTLDHIVPRGSGGANSITNLQLLCGDHNQAKGVERIDYRPEDWQERLGITKLLTAKRRSRTDSFVRQLVIGSYRE